MDHITYNLPWPLPIRDPNVDHDKPHRVQVIQVGSSVNLSQITLRLPWSANFKFQPSHLTGSY